MEKARVNPMLIYALGILATGIVIILLFKGCNRPQHNPAVDRLYKMNDSLYKVIETNTAKADFLYARIDSLTMQRDTIIQRQEITNEIYRNETYNILSSDAAGSNKQFRTTLQKSDSLLKSGFYSKTYNLRAPANEFKLQ
jgi:hypothetical protein